MAGNNSVTQASRNAGKVTLKHPAAGTGETVRLGPGETLDLSQIAAENITLLKIDGRLVVLFPDKAHVIIEGLYLNNGQTAPDVYVNIDGQTSIQAPIFVGQFPISSDEQILTAAGVSLPARSPLGSGGIDGSSGGFTPFPGNALNGLVPAAGQQGGGSSLRNLSTGPDSAIGFGAFTPTVLPPPTARADSANVVESGIQGANSPFGGTPQATGNVLSNDTLSGTGLVTGFGMGGTGTPPGSTISGTYGSLTLNSNGSYTYTINNGAPSVQGLHQGESVTETYTYSVTDASGLTTTATLVITLTGTNDLPVLDLDTGAAGTGYAGTTAGEAARSSSSITGKAGVLVSREGAVLVSDPDGDTFASLQASVSATASGDRGVLVSGSSNGASLTFTAPPGGFSAADVQTIINGLRYVNTETTFALDTADRIITLTLTDQYGGQVTVTASVPVVADVRDTTGLDAFTGTRFDDRIEGMGGSDTIRAGDGNDTVIYRAGDGADALLDGGAGTDTLAIYGETGATAPALFRVHFDGTRLDSLGSDADAPPTTPNLTGFEAVVLTGNGDDTLDYTGTTAAVSADLLAGTASGFTGISGIRNLTGGSGNDTLTGDARDNILDGGDGDDTLTGNGGNDTVYAGAGNNRVTTGAGNDHIRADDGDNIIDAGDGDNDIIVNDGNNTITTGVGNDVFFAGDGNNTINAGDGINAVLVGDGANTITTGADADGIFTGDGDNVINAGDGDNGVFLGNGNNTVTAGTGDDHIEGGDGDNTVDAGDGNNDVWMGEGSNTITTGTGADLIIALNGDNTVDAGDGDNIVMLGDGDNDIAVLDGDNQIITGDGSNTILAGDGANDITTGTGDDTMTAGDGDNTVDAGDGDNILTMGDGDNDIKAGSGDDSIATGDGDNGIDAGDGDNNVLTGAGDDQITAGGGDDTIDAGDGDNTINAGGGSNQVQSGDGFDTITLAGTGSDNVVSGAGDDSITETGSGSLEVRAGAGDDNILSGIGDDLIYGDDGFDSITTGAGSDIVAYSSVNTDGLDNIRDFVSGTDSFQFDVTDIGPGLASGGTDRGTLDSSRFVSGTAFTDADQRFLFNTNDNTLYYDADGAGAGSSAIALAHLETGTVTASDIKLA